METGNTSPTLLQKAQKYAQSNPLVVLLILFILCIGGISQLPEQFAKIDNAIRSYFSHKGEKRYSTSKLQKTQEKNDKYFNKLIRSTKKEKDLYSLFQKRNPQIWERIKYISENKKKGMTMIAGHAGVGKSYVFDRFKDIFFAKHNIEYEDYDIKDIFESWEKKKLAYAKEDLSFEGIVLNKLLSLKIKKAFDLSDVIKKQSKYLHIFDSLDEVHPDDQLKILKNISSFIQSNSDKHIIVFGRPEAFHGYFSYSKRRDMKNNPEKYTHREIVLLTLRSPIMKTTGDLLLTLQQHEEKNPPIAKNLKKRILKEAIKHQFINHTMRNLAGRNRVIAVISNLDRYERDFHSYDVKDKLFDLFLKRNTGTHNRPSRSSSSSKNADLYEKLLTKIAIKYRNEINKDGYFYVKNSDSIKIKWKEKRCSVRVSRILDLSGIAFLDPAYDKSRNYRFQPFWIHKYLIDRHNRAIPILSASRLTFWSFMMVLILILCFVVFKSNTNSEEKLGTD